MPVRPGDLDDADYPAYTTGRAAEAPGCAPGSPGSRAPTSCRAGLPPRRQVSLRSWLSRRRPAASYLQDLLG